MKSSNPRKLVRIRHKTERQSIGLHEGLLSVNPWSKGWASPRNFFWGGGVQEQSLFLSTYTNKIFMGLKMPYSKARKVLWQW